MNNKRLSGMIVNTIIIDFTDRRELRQAWDSIDVDDRLEIRMEWERLVKKLLDEQHPEEKS